MTTNLASPFANVRSDRQGARALVACVLLAVASSSSAQPLVVFGDSLSDTGNVLALTSTPEFQQLGFTPRPIAPWYATGQFTNSPAGNAGLTPTTFTGGVWINTLADRLGLARPLASGLQGNNPLGTNFAWGGAEASDQSFLPGAAVQVDVYIQNRTTLPRDPLHVFWFGGNDLINAASAPGATPASVTAAGTEAMTDLRGAMQTLISRLDTTPGAPARILWPNLPSLDRTPQGLALPADIRTALGQASADFASQQLTVAAQLMANNPNVSVITFDVLGLFNQVLDAPASFGIVNTTSPVILAPDFTQPGPFLPVLNAPAGSNPDQFVFWDDLHPTARMHALLGEAAAALIPAPGASVLLWAAGLIALRRRR